MAEDEDKGGEAVNCIVELDLNLEEAEKQGRGDVVGAEIFEYICKIY